MKIKTPQFIGGSIVSGISIIGIIYFISMYLGGACDGWASMGCASFLLVFYPLVVLLQSFVPLDVPGLYLVLTVGFLIQTLVYFGIGSLIGLIYNKIRLKILYIPFFILIIILLIIIIFFPELYYHFLTIFFGDFL